MIALVTALLSNCTLDHLGLTAACVRPFDLFADGAREGDRLAALDDFRNWLIQEAA